MLPPVCMHPGGEITEKVTSEHLNNILKTDYIDGSVSGKRNCLVLSLYPLSSCWKMYIQRVKVFTFYRYLYMQTKQWN